MRSSWLSGALLLAASSAAAAEGWRPADPGHRWAFPRDHSSHPGTRTEWWYLTGQLAALDDPGQELGFQLTFFRVGLLPAPPPLDSAWASANLVMAHAALTDLRAGAHRFSEVLWRETPFLGGFPPAPGHPLAWALGPPGTDTRWTIDFDGLAFTLSMADRAQGIGYALTARPRKPMVLHGANGYSRKATAEGYASQYYSFTRLDTLGTVTLSGRTFAVRGLAWMDREVSSAGLAPGQVGWDWWSLQLDDGRDLMIYRLRRADGSSDFAWGTLVAAGGLARGLAADAFAVRATRSWTSPKTGATYPAGWEIEVPGEGLRLLVTPALADQENRAARAGGLFYWEGAVRVRGADGRPAGRGYVELTGYGKGSRPPI